MPFTKPVTVQLVAVVVEHVKPPGVAVTTYPLTAAPPSDTGAVQETTDWPLAPFEADTDVGDPGTVEGTTSFDGSDSDCEPPVFEAKTVNV